jgi:pimeloyl-ACP methyl ester carboxylesterase
VRRELGPDGLDIGHGGEPGGHPVVLVHGVMDRGSAMLRVARLLPGASWSIYDRRGYGRSIAPTPVDVHGHIDDLIAILELVGQRSERRAVVVGHSLGGAISLAAAQRRPDLVESLFVYEAPMSWMPFSADAIAASTVGSPEEAAEAFLRRILGDDGWASLPAATRARRLIEGRALVAELTSSVRGPFFDPARVEAHVVVARGSDPPQRAILAADTILAALPDGEPLVIEGAPHGAHLTHAAELAAAVRPLLGRATSGSSVTS